MRIFGYLELRSSIRHHQRLTTYANEIDGVRRGRDRMVVGFASNYAISAYHH